MVALHGGTSFWERYFNPDDHHLVEAALHLLCINLTSCLLVIMQEGKREAEGLREKAQAAAAEAVDLSHALHMASAKLKVRPLVLSPRLHLLHQQSSSNHSLQTACFAFGPSNYHAS